MRVRIGFSTTKAWISRVIRWWTKSKVSHVFLVYFDDARGEDMVLDVAWSGVRRVSLREFHEEQNDVVALVEMPGELESPLRSAFAWLGRPYDWKTLVRFWRVARPFLKPSAGPAMICSEMVVRVLQQAGYPGALELDPKATTPHQLLQFLTR
jgi:uncharacterized protein YycO